MLHTKVNIMTYYSAFIFSFLFLVVSCITPLQLNAQEYAKGVRIIKFKEKNTPDKSTYSKFFRSQATLEPLSSRKALYVAKWDATIGETAIDDFLAGISEIEYFQRSRAIQYRSGVTPNDPEYNLQWYLEQISAHLAWAQSTGGLTYAGDTIVVAVLERRGADFTHEDLQDALWVNRKEIPNDGIDNDNNGYVDDYQGLNVVTGSDNHQFDSDSHATAVTGVMAARGNNSTGVAGVNWNIKVLMLSGIQFEHDVVESYEYIISLRERYDISGGADGAFIVATNASFGLDGLFPFDTPAWCSMYDAMGEKGILTASATANTNVNVDLIGDIPSLCPSPYLIAVTNTNQKDEKDLGAGFGRVNIDLGAPGVSILTTYSGNRYNIDDGTSYSAPLVTAAIALLYSMPSETFYSDIIAKPEETAVRVRQAILNGVDKNSSLEPFVATGGRLNIANSMKRLAESYGREFSEIVIDNLFPNPTTDELRYTFNGPEIGRFHDVYIYDMNGRMVLSTQNYPSAFGEDIYLINVSHLPGGTYTLSVVNDKEITTTKFVKLH